MADNVIRVNVTTVAPKSISIKGSREQNYINATGDTSGYNAELAKKWAIGEGLIQNIDYSSKHYAGVAKENAELTSENLNNVQEFVNGFGETVNTATGELIGTKNAVLEEINSIGSTTIQEVETVSNQVSTEIDNKAKEAVTTINNAKNSGVATIQTTTTKAIQDIETIKTNAVNTANEANATINTNKTNAITEINNTKTTAVNAVNTSKNQALNDIEKESSSIVNFKEEVQAELDEKVDIDDMFEVEFANAGSYIAGCAMPSNKYIDLTLGASGSTYTAPANGYFYVDGNGTNAHVNFKFNVNGVTIRQDRVAGNSNAAPIGLVAARKGESVIITYTTSSLSAFRFIYAEGEI